MGEGLRAMASWGRSWGISWGMVAVVMGLSYVRMKRGATGQPSQHPTNQRRARSDSSEVRARLLEAARRCVAEQGIAGATSREITERAGANLASITYYFGSKDELLADALFDDLEARISPALAPLDRDGPAAERMLATVQLLLAELDRSRSELGVHVEALVHATRDPVYGRRAEVLLGRLRDRLAALLTELRAEGVVPAWVDPVAMSSLIVATAHGIVLQAQLDPGGPDPTAMSSQFALLLLASGGASGGGAMAPPRP